MLGRTRKQRAVAVAALLAMTVVGGVDDAATADSQWPVRPRGTVWVGNRGFNAIAAYDASTLKLLRTVELAGPASDVAIGIGGKVFVGEESLDQIAVIDGNKKIKRIATADRPHHLEASRNGRWITYGAYGTNVVGVINARTGERKELAASVNPDARSHASVITADGRTVYVANDTTGEVVGLDVRSGAQVFRVEVHHAHELVLTRDERTMYVVGRMMNTLSVVDVATGVVVRTVEVGPMPDTIELVDHDRMLTIGLRGNPAQLAVIHTDSLEDVETITIDPDATTLAGHQWTSPNGRWTVAAYEGGATPGIALIDHRTGKITRAPFSGTGSRPHGLDVDR